MRNGHWVILDELNLAPTDVLEALNRVRGYCSGARLSYYGVMFVRCWMTIVSCSFQRHSSWYVLTLASCCLGPRTLLESMEEER